MRQNKFEQYIADSLNLKPPLDDLKTLNNTITEIIADDQENFYPKNQQERKINPETIAKMEQRKKLREENTNQMELNRINKDISKVIKKDLMKYKNEKVILNYRRIQGYKHTKKIKNYLWGENRF